jgi:hypothetical protein
MNDQTSDGEARSPLKEAPLRMPGQSLDAERDRLVDDVVLPYILFPTVFWIVALIEWLLSVQHAPHQPKLFAACAVILTGVAVWRIRKLWPKVRALRQGRDGERVVGQALEELRADGARVFHDVPADGFNLDHVLVMAQGVFVIETKTWSKRGKNPTISARGGRVYKDGAMVTPNPIDQARSEADWLRQMLKNSTAQDFPVRGVVLFPGWWVEGVDAETKAKAWVLNPKALRAFLAKEANVLTAADVALAAHRITLHVRGADIELRRKSPVQY